MAKDYQGNEVITVRIPKVILDDVRSNFFISDNIYNKDVINALLLSTMDLPEIKLNNYLTQFNISKDTYNQIVSVKDQSLDLDVSSDINAIQTKLNDIDLTQLNKDMNVANVFLKEIILMNRIMFDNLYMGDVTDERLDNILNKERIANLKRYTKSKSTNKKK